VAQAVKSTRRRTVYRVAAASDSAPALFVKHDHPRGPRNRARAVIRNKGHREFQAAVALAAAGVPTPRAVAWGASGLDSLVATEAVPQAVEFWRAWSAVRGDDDRRDAFLARLTAFVRCLVVGGVAHPDLHTGNVLVGWRADGPAFVLLDPHGVETQRGVSGRGPAALFGWLTPLGGDLNSEEICRLLAGSGLFEPGLPLLQHWLGIVRTESRNAARRWPTRRRRLLRNSSLCHVRDGETGRWRLRKGFAAAAAEESVRRHQTNVAEHNMLKDDVKRRLSRVHVGGTTYIIKEFRRPGPWGRWAADARSWLNAARLAATRLPAAACHGWLRGTEGQGFLVLADAGRDVAAAVLRQSTPARRRQLLKAAARLIALLHRRGIWHRDLKPTNFVVADDPVPGRELVLVDTDDVAFEATMTSTRRRRNLAQFLDGMGADLTAFERARFVVHYAHAANLSRDELRGVVGPSGVIG